MHKTLEMRATAIRHPNGTSNFNRGVFAGRQGGFSALNNTIDVIIIASTGNAKDFGDLIQGRSGPCSKIPMVVSDKYA